MIWSAGHSVAGIREIPTVEALVDSLEWQFRLAGERDRGNPVNGSLLKKESG
jgi:hypothetical protein